MQQTQAVAAEFLCPECERIFATGDERCPYDGTRLVNLGAGLAPGTVIDNRYTIKRLLGKGGMGSVYVARQHSMDRDVAVKIMHHRADGNHASVQRFFWEVRAARRLQNQHTITVFDFGQTERGSLYLAMELLKGTTLGHRLSIDARLPPAVAMRIGVQICRSLEEAHGHGIIHRDLKPENIFLSQRSGQNNFVKVLDFGVAKFLDPDGQIPLTQTGTVFGTPRYMSPEQANSEPVDARSDLYSLGILLYEMTAGKVPFAEDNPLEILYKHVHTKPMPLAEAAPWLDADPRLSLLVDLLLSKRREDRPANAHAVRQELEAILASMPNEGGLELPPVEDGPHVSPMVALNETSESLSAGEQGPTTLDGAVLRTAVPTPSLGMRGLRRDGGSVRLVGRRSEQQRAKKALDEALRAGTPKFLWLAGESGLGKQRFVRWLVETAVKELRAVVARGARVGGLANGLAEMRAAFDDVLGTALLERTALRERIEEHPAFSDRLELDLVEALVSFLRPPLAAAGAPSPELAPEDDARRHLFSALHRLLVRLAKIQPLFLDFGLLNDADPMTLRFLEFLAGALSQTPCKIAVVLRVDTGNMRRHHVLRSVHEQIGWRGGHETSVHELVALQRLDGADFLEFAQTIGRGFGHLSPYLLYLSGGNPGDAGELVQAIEQNAEHLRFARTWTPLGQRVVLGDLPSTLIDRAERVLLVAVERLGDSRDAQIILRHAALLGLSFDVSVLETALERGEKAEVLDAVEDTIEVLVQTGCLHEEKAGRLRFDSGVLRELVLSHIRSPRMLRKLHAVIAETLEHLSDPAGRDGRAIELAAHWDGAEAFDKALGYRLVTARRARAAGHKDEAIQAFALALETHQRLGPGARGDAAEREILLELGRLRFELGIYEVAAENFKQLIERALGLGDLRLVAESELGLAEVEDALAEYGS
ncbi:MAG: protein kinase, partial [Deltaproteobacteria bacterium]|nr:protein kinase [Deltaproteobacteria bacterium]